MARYLSIFFLSVLASIVFFFIIGTLFSGEGSPAEDVVFIFGALIVILLSFLITQMFYIMDLVKTRK
ncbi:hypothetical protein [Bacillus sp. 2205SS5-2]|uniref:hypothetical protein n=1 Tax=Bacillus sp. 2205SS5-2 TaxID=3109031 RepID=UPI00300465EA